MKDLLEKPLFSIAFILVLVSLMTLKGGASLPEGVVWAMRISTLYFVVACLAWHVASDGNGQER